MQYKQETWVCNKMNRVCKLGS